MQEGGYGMTMPDEISPAEVPAPEAKQAGEIQAGKWDWVERSVWTDRMLEALDKGVKGGVWFSLIDKVVRPSTLLAAWALVKANKGSAGSDHQSIKDFEVNLAGNLRQLEEELDSGRYRPRPIRRVYIDKPGSKDKRPLGIPTVRDRVVQAALRLVIEPIFEREFLPRSYGFRPGLGCKDALREVERYLKSGYSYVVDADLKAYFDSISHDLLMNDVRSRIADGRVLDLIEMFLKQEVLEDMMLWTPERGTPQGAVISPLLANLFLHSVDTAMAKAGYLMVRYADDFVVLCRTHEEAQSALDYVGTLVTGKGLTLHPVKTRLVDATIAGVGFDFLGYHFECGTRWPRKKSLKKFKDSIREKTGRSNGSSLRMIIINVNRTLKGWFEYFKHSNWKTFSPIDGWIRRRMRSILRKREKRKGVSRGWDNMRWPNKFFRDHGLFSLREAHNVLLQPLKR
jgi:RNA-directed DNA polymerase